MRLNTLPRMDNSITKDGQQYYPSIDEAGTYVAFLGEPDEIALFPLCTMVLTEAFSLI
ncbi:hypothetical protein DPMN_010561 [Dreissena polymorpha]|uniref:Uncharacterized protein n=1 Tax=Dreissena polymorpha TaxID=45954 RepID=A0A9D4N049_DREPO|nr:hypothetical protein DPMN_010561 [Dreissena polymorpha]